MAEQSKLELSKESTTLKVGATEDITVTVDEGADFTVKENNADKVTATKGQGKITLTAKAQGSGTVTVESEFGGKQKTTKTINVTVEAAQPAPETTLTLNPSKAFSIKKGETKDVTVQTNATSFTVESKDTGKFTVKKGTGKFTVTAVEVGTAKVEVKATAASASEKVVSYDITVTEADTEEPDTSSELLVHTKNIKGEAGTEQEINLEFDGKFVIESSDPAVCSFKQDKTVSLNKVGTCTLKVKSVNTGEDGVKKEFSIPVHVVKPNTKLKVDYTAEEIRDLFLSCMRIEDGFAPGAVGGKVICELNKNHFSGKLLIEDRGLVEAKLEITDYKGGVVYVQMYAKNEYGPIDEEGKHGPAREETKNILVPFYAGQFDKKDVHDMYKKFQHFVVDMYCK